MKKTKDLEVIKVLLKEQYKKEKENKDKSRVITLDSLENKES